MKKKISKVNRNIYNVFIFISYVQKHIYNIKFFKNFK